MSAEFVITSVDHGNTLGTDGRQRVLLMGEGGRMFKRNAIKAAGSPSACRQQWLVTELDGVRVYVSDADIVVTREDLYP